MSAAANRPAPAAKATRKPTHRLVLPPSTFSEEWSQRPTDDIVVGLRRLSAFDDQSAVVIAAKRVIEVLSDDNAHVIDAQAADEVYNNELFAYAVARALCDPNDTNRTHLLFPFPEDQVSQFFTSPGIRFVWDHLHKMRLEQSPLVAPASDGDINAIAHALLGGAISKLSASAQTPARKLLTALAEFFPESADAEDDDEATTEANTYIVTGS